MVRRYGEGSLDDPYNQILASYWLYTMDGYPASTYTEQGLNPNVGKFTPEELAFIDMILLVMEFRSLSFACTMI